MRERRVHLARTPAGSFGAFAAGLAFGAGWTPCLGPVLGALLTLGTTRDTVAGGMLLLGAYALGLALPFAAAAFATERFLGASRRFRHFAPTVEKVSGVLLIVMGVLLITGSFTVLSGYFLRLTPQFLLERL
jgi:cytochrome c-type biogenesis protein